MARGNNGQDIVAKPSDWMRLHGVIAKVKRTSDFTIYAYCLLNNHFHLLVRVGTDPLSRFMHRIQSTWSKRFNLMHSRKGHLFQNRFKSLPCDSDTYFKWLLRYIHLNPVRAHLVERPEDWPWSSYREFLDPESAQLCDSEWPLSLFGSERRGSTASFRDFVLLGLGEEPKPFSLIDSREPQLPARETPSREPQPTLQQLAFEAATSHGIDPAAILTGCRIRQVCAARRVMVTRAIACGYSNIDLARALRVSTSAVSRMVL